MLTTHLLVLVNLGLSLFRTFLNHMINPHGVKFGLNFFGMIMINDPRSFGSWCNKGTDDNRERFISSFETS